MKKQLPIFWILLSFIYLLIEVMFRADVIELAATSGDQQQLIALEHVGRFISSLGVAIFLTSLLKTNPSHSPQQRLYRRLAMLPVFVASYLISSLTQEWAIDKYASEAPPEFKREASLANAYRDMMYFNKANKSPDLQWLTSDEQVLLALTPLLVYGDPGLDKLSRPDHADFMKQISAMKLEKTASVSDPRVFDYHRQWLKAVGWEYQRLVANLPDPADTKIQSKTENLYHLMLKEGWRIVESASRQATVQRGGAEPSYASYESALKELSWIGLDFGSSRGPRLRRGATSMSSLFAYSDAAYFSEKFHENIAKIYFNYLQTLKGSNADDANLQWFFRHNDFNALKKYYGLKISMRDACKVYPGKDNEFMLVTHAADEKFLSYPLSENLAKELHVMLTGAVKKTPVIIGCNYAYESTIKQMRGIKSILEQRAAAYNPSEARRLAGTNVATVKSSALFKYTAISVMLEEDRKLRQRQYDVNDSEQTARPSLTRFEDMAQYDRFVSAIDLSSLQSFDRSLRQAKERLSKDAFVRWTARAGFDFSAVMQSRPGFRFYNQEVFEDPKFVSVIKKAMPQVFHAKGTLIALDVPSTPREVSAFVKTLPLSSRTKIRALYADMMYSQQENIFADSSLLNEGSRLENVGKNTAKGFIAPAFVLFVSNIMIAITLINMVSSLILHYVFSRPSVVRTMTINVVAACCLLGPSLLISNGHIQRNIDASRHSPMVQQTHLTANLQKVYDVILPSFIRPTWLYTVIKVAVSPRERFVTLF